MRASWSGSIAINLFSVPVQLYKATEPHEGPKTYQVHEKDGGRIRYKRFCELEESEVPYDEITKGVEVDEDEQVILTKADLENLPVPSLHVIDVQGFVDAGTFDPMQFDQAYFVGLGKRAPDKPYVLLREAMRESGKVAVAKVTLSTKESLAVVRVVDDLLMLHTMLWPDEVRQADLRTPSATVHANELRMAQSLLDEVTKGFSIEDLHDEYREAMQELIDAKQHGTKPTAPAKPTEDSNVIDITEILNRAIESERARKTGTSGGSGDSGEAAESAPAAKKAAAKTASPRKTAASKQTAAKKAAPAKKTAAKKTAAKKTTKKSTTSRKAG
ncbi:Ku protein [Actinospica sp. MGRD01-02]|uniref:Non-homologous end joining protein Ku n=1 Tax=Actinospica acidithermotolerans TaxID=2828514 RepID=A0A941E4J1_9ACTN|nr:Ku protein [Actinospica acidithermotolerans]MBR7824986.1 Ku protein [Actinospica acidithermotolerans]